MLDNSGADVRLAFVDACQSGVLTRTKAASRAPSFVFELSERLGTRGTVIVTSSAGDETSQESDEIGGSYFTHYLVSALYGAADRDHDQLVTLAEAYDYVYAETVLRTAGTRGGTQHPSFGWDLTGEGDLILTDLDASRAALIFDPSMSGSYAVFDLTRRSFVAEVNLKGTAQVDQKLAVRPRRIQVQERFPTHMRVADTVIRTGETVAVQDLEFRSVRYEDDVAKGWLSRQARRARLPDSSVRLVSGVIGAVGNEVASEYLPPMVGVGASVRLQQDGKWAVVDIQGVRVRSQVEITGIAKEPVAVGGAIGGIGAGFSTLDRGWQAGGGLRIDGLVLRRTFPSDGTQQPQWLNAPALGVTGFIGWHPGRFELDMDVRIMAVPITFEQEQFGFLMASAALSGGYRF
jgi:hypothetical protein